MNRRDFAFGFVAGALVAGAIAALMVARRETGPVPTAPVEQPARPAEPTAPAAARGPSPVPTPESTAPRRGSAPAAKRSTPAPSAAPAAAAAAPDTATLNIRSDVPGAQVFIDREFVGVAPVTVRGVAPGARRLNVSAQGYEGYADTLDVMPGSRDVIVNFKTVRLDLTLDVVHKHRFGSCRGRLIATPDGVRYETTDKDDVFSVKLLDLETFQIDYLDKNLRIQPRKGRRYDFTDSDGNADRLFVFHRDVEKARARLGRD